MRKVVVSVGFLLVLAPAAGAQDVEFFGGYSYLRATGGNSQKIGLNGWNGEISANLGSWGVVADLSNYYGASATDLSPIGSGGHGFTYLFGPQYSFRTIPRVTPFVHALFGGTRGVRFGPPLGVLVAPCPPFCGTPTAPETAFAFAVGGGVDVKAVNHVWIRLGQLDYIREDFSAHTITSPRFSAGIVFRLGRR
jgi:opacity protein-like surface antigen